MIPGGEGLLRALLAQRLDTVLRQFGVAGPQAARALAGASQDPRAPSRDALDRQAQAGPAPAPARHARSGDAAAPALPQLSDTAAPAAAATWSGGARAIAAMLEPGAPPVRGAAPLWPHPSPPAVPELAHALARAVEGSGLFYEAHLQQFAAGTRSLADLRREPQALLQAAATATADEAPDTSMQADASDAAPASSPAPAQAGPPVHPATLPVVQQQLELLATGVFRWSGEPWPGARMEWEVREEPDRRAPEVDAAGRAWSTRLQLVLPVLGAVDAALCLDADGGVQVRVAAVQPEAARALQEARPALLERLARARLPVRGCRVEAA